MRPQDESLLDQLRETAKEKAQLQEVNQSEQARKITFNHFRCRPLNKYN